MEGVAIWVAVFIVVAVGEWGLCLLVNDIMGSSCAWMLGCQSSADVGPSSPVLCSPRAPEGCKLHSTLLGSRTQHLATRCAAASLTEQQAAVQHSRTTCMGGLTAVFPAAACMLPCSYGWRPSPAGNLPNHMLLFTACRPKAVLLAHMCCCSADPTSQVCGVTHVVPHVVFAVLPQVLAMTTRRTCSSGN